MLLYAHLISKFMYLLILIVQINIQIAKYFNSCTMNEKLLELSCLPWLFKVISLHSLPLLAFKMID